MNDDQTTPTAGEPKAERPIAPTPAIAAASSAPEAADAAEATALPEAAAMPEATAGQGPSGAPQAAAAAEAIALPEATVAPEATAGQGPSSSPQAAAAEPARPTRAALPSIGLHPLLLGLIIVVAAYFRFLGPPERVTYMNQPPPDLSGLQRWIRSGDWDSGAHLHPDERFLTMVADNVSLPQNLGEYFRSEDSPLNPRNRGHAFYVYGSLPVAFVVAVATALGLKDYSTVHLVGRKLMAISDLVAILLLYWWARRRYGRRVALLAAALSAVTAFAIQQSHFFTVDTMANLSVIIALVAAEALLDRGSLLNAAVAGGALGLALANKLSVWPLGVVLLVVLWWTCRTPAPDDDREGGILELDLRRFLALGTALGLAAFVILRIAEPDMWVGPGWLSVKQDPGRYAELSSKGPAWWSTLERLLPDALEPLFLPEPRWADNVRAVREQITGHGSDWPPNHQWWGRTPYLFPLRNMVVYGMGWPLGLAAWLGWLAAAWQLLRRGRIRHLVPVLWVGALFAALGGQWVTSMRYFLPIYPALTLLAAWLLVSIWDWTRGRPFDAPASEGPAAPADGAGAGPSDDEPEASESTRRGRSRAAFDRPVARLLRRPALGLALLALVLAGTALWGFMFSRIYASEHSRIVASRWLYREVPGLVSAVLAPSDEGKYLPAGASGSLSFDPDGRFVVENDRKLDLVRLQVPTLHEVRMTGVLVRHLTDPAGDAAPETVRAYLSTRPNLDAAGNVDGEIGRGETQVPLDRSDERDVEVPFTEAVTLKPGGEYYVWVEFAGAPIAGRQVTLGSETHWDDMIPTGGREGVPAFDDMSTPNAEGIYGGTNTELYDEDDLGKVDRLVDWLAKSDYIAITSNRVYGSVKQLPTRFPMTIKYYDLLYGEKLGFKHLADIHSYPRLGPIEVNDQPAEEAFHVYDHPKVDVFMKTKDFDAALAKRILAPEVAKRHWEWPSTAGGGLASQLLQAITSRLPGAPAGGAVTAGPKPLSSVMLSPERQTAERNGPNWRDLFDISSMVNRQPALAVLLWYLTLLLVGVLAFPLTATALQNLSDRGWAISRVVGLLLIGWFAWWVASLRLVPHTPLLVMACAVALALLSGAVGWRGRRELVAWLGANRRLIVAEELVFLALFAIFLAIRLWNPDLWHPYYGGEKPMDLAYLNATLRAVSFPPYDPWFAGGKLNYYYYGFVFIGALIELTRIVPWLAYNLALPSLAAMTGLGVFGIVYHWSRWLRRSFRTGVASGGLGAVLAVLCGNLYQVQMIGNNMANLGEVKFQSELPGVMFLERLLTGVVAGFRVWFQTGNPPVERFNHLYWNASRAIPAFGDTEPITEFPFFTFLYADLHAHMMALPLTVLAFTVALSWASPSMAELRAAKWFHPWHALRLALGAIAIGSLWPANTWDFPTYGLVAAGALAAGFWQVRPKLDFGWLMRWGAQGALLLVLALAAFAPYHLNYVTPYSNFRAWDSYRTPFDAYLTVHGLFLFAILSWALAMTRRILMRGSEAHGQWRAAGTSFKVGAVGAIAVLALFANAHASWPAGKVGGPSLGLAVFVSLALAMGLCILAWRPTRPAERFAAWLLVLGLVLTQFVEYVVLDGDIARMNTVFKFYIQVWILWATLAAVSVAWLAPWLRRARRPATWWLNAFGVLVACGLLYTVTASRAKIADRFDPMAGLTEEERAAYTQNYRPGLSGIDYMSYALYDDDGHPLRLRYDLDAMMWMLEHIDGNPVILEWMRDSAYKWGSRYANNTGLPTVQGWDWHEKQQRNAVGGEVVTQRVADVHEMYNTTDEERAWTMLGDYHVEYVVVGEQETAFAAPEGLAKFERWTKTGRAEVVHTVTDPLDPSTPKVTLYHLMRPEVTTR